MNTEALGIGPADPLLIFGANGFMGTALRSVFPQAVTPRVDIADRQQVASALDEYRPAVVINAAGRSGHPNVDWCETHREETIRSNVTGPLTLLELCAARHIYWVHIGTGCVYEGSNEGNGFAESDPPNFSGSFYARTKSWIDQMLADFPVLVVRPRMPFDHSDHPRNLIAKLRKYDKLLDEPNSLTSLDDFTHTTRELVRQRATGVFNVVNPGASSPWRVMELYRELVDPNYRCQRIDRHQLSELTLAARSNCLLSTKKLADHGIHLVPVETALRRTLKRMQRGR